MTVAWRSRVEACLIRSILSRWFDIPTLRPSACFNPIEPQVHTFSAAIAPPIHTVRTLHGHIAGNPCLKLLSKEAQSPNL